MRRRLAPPNAGSAWWNRSSSVSHSSTRRTCTVRRPWPLPLSDIDSKVATRGERAQMCDNPRMRTGCRPFCSLAFLLFLVVPAAAQSIRPKDIATGKLLVASRDLGDPNFSQTVVLLVHMDDDGVVGLILNRRTNVPVTRALENLKSAKGRPD